MNARGVLNRIFKDPNVQFRLVAFEGLEIHKIIKIYEKVKGRYYVKCFKRNKEIFVYSEKKSCPEEIIRQLFLYKLVKELNYPLNLIDVEVPVKVFSGKDMGFMDIVVYKPDKKTVYMIFETKRPKIKEGLTQLKDYMGNKWCELGIWSNGSETVVLHRPYPEGFETLERIPMVDEKPEDIYKVRKTLNDLKKDYNLKNIIHVLQELVLANAGVSVFRVIFKLLYAKLYDEKEAKIRKNKEVEFVVSHDPKVTFDKIIKLFKNSIKEWPGIFSLDETIELTPDHLQICVSQMENLKLLDADIRVMDEAFEYLIPEVSKTGMGQYFTPRYVIDMCVRMLNPGNGEYIIDPACGSGGFLIQSMNWVWRNDLKYGDKKDKTDYAQKYLYGIDIWEEAVKIARALMLIAGDGKAHIHKLNSLDPDEWKGDDPEITKARADLSNFLYDLGDYDKNKDNKQNFRFFNFDILLTNPPFAGEIRQDNIKSIYEFSKNESGKIPKKVERDLLFIERSLQFIKPGGRMAIILPQGKLNNLRMEYIRKAIRETARIIAIVSLGKNTFKLPPPAKGTSTKTSILFVQKWDKNERAADDYDIFMAISQKPGKDNSGNYIFKKDKDGKYIEDTDGNRIVDHDLDEIASTFCKLAKKQNLSFWRDS